VQVFSGRGYMRETVPNVSIANCAWNGSGKAPAKSNARSSPVRWSSAAPPR